MRNYNTLIGRYPGADGMKTGFICASGFNLVASATRNGRRLIAVVLGACSGAVRAQKAAQLLERGFNSGALSWLTPSLGTVDALQPIDAAAAQPARRDVRRPSPQAGRREDNDEEDRQTPPPATATPAAHAFMLSEPEAVGTANSCSARRSITEPPIVGVHRAAPSKPDAVEQTAAVRPDEAARKKKNAGHSPRSRRPQRSRAGRRSRSRGGRQAAGQEKAEAKTAPRRKPPRPRK